MLNEEIRVGMQVKLPTGNIGKVVAIGGFTISPEGSPAGQDVIIQPEGEDSKIVFKDGKATKITFPFKPVTHIAGMLEAV